MKSWYTRIVPKRRAWGDLLLVRGWLDKCNIDIALSSIRLHTTLFLDQWVVPPVGRRKDRYVCRSNNDQHEELFVRRS